MNDPPVTQWIRGSERRESDSEQALWDHYFDRVVRLARSRMFAIQASVYDEEDAAVSALHSLFRGLRNQRFPELYDRHNLWRLLILITKRKLRAQWRRETSKGRSTPPSESDFSIAEVLCDQPTPDFVAEMMDETEHLLQELGDDILRKIAVLRMDGFSTDEIAEQLGCTSRTVRRKLERIRDLWGISEEF